MIPEMVWYGLLFVAVICLLMLLAESETLAEWSERRHVNWLADRSKKRKAATMRERCRYARAYMRPDL